MTEIIKVVDNIVTEHSFINRELRDGEIEVNNWNGTVGDSLVEDNIVEDNIVEDNIVENTVKAAKAVEAVKVEEPEEEVYVVEEPQEEVVYKDIEPEPLQLTRTDELMIQLQQIDLASVRAIRAILAGTDTEEDHKTLEALEKQAVALRKELNDDTESCTTESCTTESCTTESCTTTNK